MYTLHDLFKQLNYVFGHVRVISDIEYNMNEDGTFSNEKYYNNPDHHQAMYVTSVANVIKEFNAIKSVYHDMPIFTSMWHNQAVAYRAYCDWILERSSIGVKKGCAERKLLIRSMLNMIVRAIRALCLAIIGGSLFSKNKGDFNVGMITSNLFPKEIVIVRSHEPADSGLHVKVEQRILDAIATFGCMITSVINNGTLLREGFAPRADLISVGPEFMIDMLSRDRDAELDWKTITNVTNSTRIVMLYECLQHYMLLLWRSIEIIMTSECINKDRHLDFDGLLYFVKDTHESVINEKDAYKDDKIMVPIIDFDKAIGYYKEAEL